MPQPTAEQIVEAAQFTDFDQASTFLQDIMGVTDGGFAARFFADAEAKYLAATNGRAPSPWGQRPESVRLDLLRRYANEEWEGIEQEAIMAAEDRLDDRIPVLLTEGVSVSNTLTAAIRSPKPGCLNTVRTVLDHVKQPTPEAMESAFHAAAEQGRTDVLSLLLERGAEIGRLGGAALQRAVANGRTEATRFLLDRGVLNSGQLLDRAAREGFVGCVRVLAATLTPVTLGDAIPSAADAGHLTVVRTLFDLGAQPLNGNLERALYNAANRGHADVAALLLARGADPSVRHRDLMAAAERSNAATFALMEDFMERGPTALADYSVVTAPQPQATVRAADQKVRRLLDTLTEIAETEPIDVGDDAEWIAGTRRAASRVVREFEQAMQQQAVPSPQTVHEATELLVQAAKEGNVSAIQPLLERGADIHADGDWPLRAAATNGHTAVVRLLLDRGADLHAHDDYAFHFAAMYGHKETAALLKARMDEDRRRAEDAKLLNDWRPETRALLQGLAHAGLKPVKVSNGEEKYPYESDDQAIAVLTATDESNLYVACPDGKIRSLFLVYGNSPGELVCDHSGGYAPLEAAVTVVADAWEGREQPKATKAELDAFTKAHYPSSPSSHTELNLHEAARRGLLQDPGVAPRLTEHSIGLKNEAGQTVAHVAAVHGNFHQLPEALQTVASIMLRNDDRQTVLEFAHASETALEMGRLVASILTPKVLAELSQTRRVVESAAAREWDLEEERRSGPPANKETYSTPDGKLEIICSTEEREAFVEEYSTKLGAKGLKVVLDADIIEPAEVAEWMAQAFIIGGGTVTIMAEQPAPRIGPPDEQQAQPTPGIRR